MDEQNLVSWKNKDEFYFNGQSIIKNEKFKELLTVLSKSTRFGFKIVDYRGEVLCEPIQMPAFCTNAKQIGHINELCKMSDSYGVIQAAVGQKLNYFYCSCGMLQMSIPIIVNSAFLGGIICGPIRCDKKEAFLSAVENISFEDKRELKENDVCQKRYAEIEVLSFEHFQKQSEMIAYVIQAFIENEYNIATKARKTQQLEEALEKKQKEIEHYQKEIQKRVTNLSESMLLNGLNTIACLATIENAYQTNEAVMTLVDLVRETIVNQQKDKSLEKELTQIEKYLSIQKTRFGEDKMTYVIKSQVEELQQIMIPSGFLLPLIENIVINGILGSKEKCHIEIKTRIKENILEILIDDDCSSGTGNFLRDACIMKNDPDGSVGYILEQFKQRMHYELNEKCQMQIMVDEEKHTTIKLKIQLKQYNEM